MFTGIQNLLNYKGGVNMKFEITYLPAERLNKHGYLGGPLTEIVEASSESEAIAQWQKPNTSILTIRRIRR